MFSRRGPILIVISLLLAVGAAWVANRWLVSQASSGASAPNTSSVMTAAIDIPLGTKIEARHLSAIQMLADTAPEGAYHDAASIEGKIVDFDRATVLVLVAVGFGLAGIVGGVLALPVAAIARDLFAYAFRTAQAESAVVAES